MKLKYVNKLVGKEMTDELEWSPVLQSTIAEKFNTSARDIDYVSFSGKLHTLFQNEHLLSYLSIYRGSECCSHNQLITT